MSWQPGEPNNEKNEDAMGFINPDWTTSDGMTWNDRPVSHKQISVIEYNSNPN